MCFLINNRPLFGRDFDVEGGRRSNDVELYELERRRDRTRSGPSSWSGTEGVRWVAGRGTKLGLLSCPPTQSSLLCRRFPCSSREVGTQERGVSKILLCRFQRVCDDVPLIVCVSRAPDATVWSSCVNLLVLTLLLILLWNQATDRRRVDRPQHFFTTFFL